MLCTWKDLDRSSRNKRFVVKLGFYSCGNGDIEYIEFYRLVPTAYIISHKWNFRPPEQFFYGLICVLQRKFDK